MRGQGQPEGSHGGGVEGHGDAAKEVQRLHAWRRQHQPHQGGNAADGGWSGAPAGHRGEGSGFIHSQINSGVITQLTEGVSNSSIAITAPTMADTSMLRGN